MNREELLVCCFGDDAEPRGKRYYEDSESREGERAVIAHVGRAYRRVVAGNTTVWVVAISNLCVDPDYRGRGRARDLLERVHAEARLHAGVGYAAVFALDRRIFDGFGYEQVDPVGHPDLLVLQLGDEPWPRGYVDTYGEW